VPCRHIDQGQTSRGEDLGNEPVGLMAAIVAAVLCVEHDAERGQERIGAAQQEVNVVVVDAVCVRQELAIPATARIEQAAQPHFGIDLRPPLRRLTQYEIEAMLGRGEEMRAQTEWFLG